MVNRRENTEILLYYTQIDIHGEKKSQIAIAKVFTNINEPSRKGIVDITHLASMKASLIYRISQ